MTASNRTTALEAVADAARDLSARRSGALIALRDAIADLDAASVPKESPRSPFQWPDCEPPTTSEIRYGFYGILGINGKQYQKTEVEPGRWRWLIDEEAEETKRIHEARKKELWWALRTRVISDEEMDAVLGYRESINIQYNAPYSAVEKQRELSDAFVTQERLRAARRSGGEIG